MAAALSIGLTWIALLAAPGGPRPVDRVETLLEQVAQLPPADQQRFLVWVEARFRRANAIVLGPDEAAAADAVLGARLRRERLTWPALRRLLGDLDRREGEAIEALTRGYRLQTFRTFRNARDAYQQRQQAWFDLWAAWQAAGRPLAYQHELVEWLVAGIRRSRPDTLAALPPAPRFEPRSLAAVLPQPRRSSPPQPAAPDTPTDAFGEPAIPVVSTEPRLSDAPVRPASPRSDESISTPMDPGEHLLSRQSEAGGTLFGKFVPLPADASATVDRGVWTETRLLRPNMLPDAPDLSAFLAGSASRKPVPVSVAAVADAAAPPVAPDSPAVPPGMDSFVETEPTEHAVSHRPALPDRPAFSLPTIPIADGAPRVVQPGRSQAAVEPAASHPTFALAPARTVRRPLPDRMESLASDASTGGEPVLPGVRVNLTELRSRIAGTNMALRALESELIEPRRWTADLLASRIARLHSLTLRVQDMRMFREMVPEEMRRLVDAADSPRPAVTLLAARIAETRQRTTRRPYRGTERERQAELEKLDNLSRRLVEVAGLLDR